MTITRKLALAAGLTALTLGLSAAPAVQAETSRLAIDFSWQSNGLAHLPKGRQRVAQAVVPGSSGWICVPAGFGRHSHCYMQ